MDLSKHAKKRCQQFGISVQTLQRILRNGKVSSAKDNALLFSAYGKWFPKSDRANGIHLMVDRNSNKIITVFKNKNFKLHN